MPDTQDMARHTNRDKLGRFARSVHEDEIRWANGGVIYTDARGDSHAYAHCNNAEGECVKGQIDSSDCGWLCCACITVGFIPTWVDMPLSKVGTKVCNCCDVEMPVTKFDIIRIEGVRFREDRSMPCIKAERAAKKAARDAARRAAEEISEITAEGLVPMAA